MGLVPESNKLSQESRAPSVSPVATTGSHSARHHRISSDQSQESDDDQPPEGSSCPSPSRDCQWSHSPGYESSFVTCHEPIVMTISVSGAKVHNPKDTHSQMGSTLGRKQRSSSSESSHETSVGDSVKKKKKKKKHKKKKKKHKKKKSTNKSPAPKVTSFTMHLPPDSMVKDYDWMQNNNVGPDQSNQRVIIVDEPSEDDEASHHDLSMGNPFTGSGDMMVGHTAMEVPDLPAVHRVVMMVVTRMKISVPWSKLWKGLYHFLW